NLFFLDEQVQFAALQFQRPVAVLACRCVSSSVTSVECALRLRIFRLSGISPRQTCACHISLSKTHAHDNATCSTAWLVTSFRKSLSLAISLAVAWDELDVIQVGHSPPMVPMLRTARWSYLTTIRHQRIVHGPSRPT